MKSSPIVLAVLLSLAACAAPSRPPAAQTLPVTTAAPPHSIAVTAHRGGAGLAPENTLAAFRNALSLGVDAVELDVHLSQDGQVVVMHDSQLERTTNGHGQIYDYSLSDLEKLNAAAKTAGASAAFERIPTLAEVLDLYKGRRERFEIEIKVPPRGRYPGIERKVLEGVRAAGMAGRVQISSFDFDTLREVKSLDPAIPTVALLSVDFFRQPGADKPEAICNRMREVNVDIIGVNKDLLTLALVQQARARGLKVQVWTVDDPAEMTRLAGWRVDGITSDRPDLVKQVLGR